ncbi:hypothetical protein FRB95_004152 [Tulasnella sp. JGI-2019a]|nr:hypothetical protein FRB95_004152 [Tulasnella sp. JGI-2019a]
MLVNASTALIGTSVVLVPYRREHVPTYHQWMSNPELLRLTASEPLSFEEELDMQRKWQEDDDKLTFIVLARSEGDPDSLGSISNAEISRLPMIGDVNLFFKRNGDDEESASSNNPYDEVECEVMIAEPAYRGKSLGFTALSILLPYATTPPPSGPGAPPNSLVARIGLDNAPSIALFQRLGFVKTKAVEVFGELEMRYHDRTSWSKEWQIREYPATGSPLE